MWCPTTTFGIASYEFLQVAKKEKVLGSLVHVSREARLFIGLAVAIYGCRLVGWCQKAYSVWCRQGRRRISVYTRMSAR